MVIVHAIRNQEVNERVSLAIKSPNLPQYSNSNVLQPSGTVTAPRDHISQTVRL